MITVNKINQTKKENFNGYQVQRNKKKSNRRKEKRRKKNSSHVVKAFFKLQYRLTCIHHNQSFNSRCIPTHDHEEERQRQFDGGSDPNIMGVEHYI